MASPKKSKNNIFVEVRVIEAGACTHPGFVVTKGAGLKSIRFPSTVGVIKHPTEGVILFDTGYTERFYEETKNLPNKLYALITPTTILPSQTAASQLLKLGIKSSNVKHIIISHFHADHIAGLKDFPKASYIYLNSCFDAVKNLSGLRALKNAYFPGLLPKDFEKRSHVIPDAIGTIEERAALSRGPRPHTLEQFKILCDLFDDGSMLIVDLPGHTKGQIGLIAKTKTQNIFFVADACWQETAYTKNLMPHPITNILTHDSKAYKETILKLSRLMNKAPDHANTLRSDIKPVCILPCHCDSAHDRFKINFGQNAFL